MEILIYLIFLIFMVAGAYVIGTMIEVSHYEDIEKREKDYISLPVVSSKAIEIPDEILQSELVTGNVVISSDYFKSILAGLRNITGGRIKSYETLLDRGRREAILRMKQQARAIGADIILNMRFETSTIGLVTGRRGRALGWFEILAYGTAVKLRK